MLKAYQRCSLRTKKHLAIVRQLKHLSKNHQLSLKKIIASKFYPTQNHYQTQNYQSSAFSSIMHSKDKNLMIVNSDIITNLNSGYNSYTEIENACNKISEQFADGTFYLNNNYPAISCAKNLSRQKQSFEAMPDQIKSNQMHQKNLSSHKFNGCKISYQNKKQFKDNNLVSKFFA